MKFPSRWLARTALFAMIAASALPQSGITQTVTVRDDDAVARRATDALLDRKISVDLDNVTLAQAIKAVADEAHVTVLYQRESIAKYARSVTLQTTKESLRSVFVRLFQGTTLQVVARPNERLVVVDGAGSGTDSNGAAQAGGRIVGQVRDSAGVPLANVRIALRGTKRIVETNAEGRFQLADVPTGTYLLTASRLGYAPDKRTVNVAGTDAVTVTFILRTMSTRLTEVVTTATGGLERLKVGNDVGTINADSLVQNTMIRNVSDLLTAHTPGVQATPTGGAIGAPTRIRVRGVTSTQLNNDPIVVVDGVRINAQTTRNAIEFQGFPLPSSQVNTGSQTVGGEYGLAAAPSPLDQIDPNMIESIDVLKGPTATALYGPDASTGVIVIKTKAGKPGPWRYHASGDYGWIVPPRTYPQQWTGWGHAPAGGASQPNCNLVTFYDLYVGSQSNGGCLFDSVTAFNPQNDRNMTTLGTGYNRGIVMDASGGGSTVQGFIQGDYSDAVGQQRLPRVEERRLARMWTTPVPSWMKRPNGQINMHVTSKVDAQFTPAVDLSVTGQGTYQNTRNGGSGASSSPVYGRGDTLTYLPAENLRTRSTSSTKRGIVAGNARYQAVSWLILTGTGGLDYSLRDDQTLRRPQDCTPQLNPNGCGSSSMHSATRTEVLVPSFTAGATFTYDATRWLQLHTSFGEQYSRTQAYIMGVNATGLAFGQNSITGADDIETPTEVTDEGASAGWYAEQQLAFNQRLFLTAALRRDASSSFGGSIATPTFPKYGASWVVSNEPFFPRQNVLTQLRLRTAYGESGKQGSQTDVLRSFFYSSGMTPDGKSGPVLLLSGLGNPQLQPQRDREWEGGFDLGVYNDRATLTATWYRKQSSNAIVSINVPPSPGAVMPMRAANAGAIRNTGYELQLSLRPVDAKLVTWDFNFQASRNHNLLVDKGNLPDLPSAMGGDYSGGVFRPGYPLFGYWQQPVVAYGDYDHDGILEVNEIAFADSEVFVGSADPSGTFAYSNSLTFLDGRMRFNSMINQVKGLTTRLAQQNTRGLVDPTSSIAEQAAAIQAAKEYGYVGAVSYVQLAELSASYTLPAWLARRMHSQSATVTVAGRNLALWTNYRGADPTTNQSNSLGDQGVDSGGGLAQPRNWVMRLNFQF